MAAPLEFSDSRLTRARNSDLRPISNRCAPEGDEETRHENLKDIGQDLAHHWVQPSARGKRIVRVLPPPVGDPAPPRNNFCELEHPPRRTNKKKRQNIGEPEELDPPRYHAASPGSGSVANHRGRASLASLQ